MKSIREWLELLPEPYKGQALTNSGGKESLDLEENTLFDALASAFIWNESAEGEEYWRTLAEDKVLPYAGQTEPPTNALSALHAIALKEGFAVEEIMSVTNKYGHVWGYWLKGVPHELVINLSTDK